MKHSEATLNRYRYAYDCELELRMLPFMGVQPDEKDISNARRLLAFRLISLCYFDGKLTAEQIAEATGVSPNTVKHVASRKYTVSGVTDADADAIVSCARRYGYFCAEYPEDEEIFLRGVKQDLRRIKHEKFNR